MIFPEKGSLDFAFRGNLWKGEFPPKARSICFFACWTFKRLEDSLLSAAAMNQSLTVEPKRSVSYRYDREIAEVVLASMGKLLCTSLVNLSEQWVSAFLCLFFFFLPSPWGCAIEMMGTDTVLASLVCKQECPVPFSALCPLCKLTD